MLQRPARDQAKRESYGEEYLVSSPLGLGAGGVSELWAFPLPGRVRPRARGHVMLPRIDSRGSSGGSTHLELAERQQAGGEGQQCQRKDKERRADRVLHRPLKVLHPRPVEQVVERLPDVASWRSGSKSTGSCRADTRAWQRWQRGWLPAALTLALLDAEFGIPAGERLQARARKEE